MAVSSGMPRKTHLWLSRQQDESYLLTTMRPIKHAMAGENYEWLYPALGEPIKIELCEVGVHKLMKIKLEVFESIVVEVNTSIV